MFDSPIFWVILVWWLLTKFLGVGKRRPVRQVEYEPDELSDDMIFEEVELDQPDSPVEPQPAEQSAPPPTVSSRPTLKDLWRTLERELEGVVRPAAPGPVASSTVPEFTTPPVQPAKPPAVPVPPPMEAEPERHHKHHDTASWGKKAAYRNPLERYSSRWTVAQQAVVFREILGPPIALRRTRQR